MIILNNCDFPKQRHFLLWKTPKMMNHHDGLTLVDLYFSRLNYTKSLHFRTIYKQKRDSASNSQFFVVNKHRWPNKQGMIFAKLNSCQPAVQITRFYTHVCMHIFFSSVFLDFSFKFAAPNWASHYDIKLYHQSQNNLANQEDHWKNLRRKSSHSTQFQTFPKNTQFGLNKNDSKLTAQLKVNLRLRFKQKTRDITYALNYFRLESYTKNTLEDRMRFSRQHFYIFLLIKCFWYVLLKFSQVAVSQNENKKSRRPNKRV